MGLSETIAIILVLLFYTMVAFLVGNAVRNSLDNHPAYMFFADDKIVHNDDIVFLRDKDTLISFTIGALWIFAIVFKLGSDIGGWIYEDLIIKGNEEDRIASWFV